MWPDGHERTATLEGPIMANKSSAAQQLGRLGGLARAKKLTKQQRVAGARKAGLASGKARRAKKKGAPQ